MYQFHNSYYENVGSVGVFMLVVCLHMLCLCTNTIHKQNICKHVNVYVQKR